MTKYGQLLLTIAAADGELTQAEWDCFYSIGEAAGAPAAVIDQMRKWDYRSARIEDYIGTIKEAGFARSVLHDAIKVSRADGVYGKGEREAAARTASALGVDQPTLAAIEGLVEMESALRATRLALLYPKAPTVTR
jgi:tellurite resistance protein